VGGNQDGTQAGTGRATGSADIDGRVDGGPVGGFEATDIARWRREMQGSRSDLDALIRNIRVDRRDHRGRDIDDLIERMEELGEADLYHDPDALLERQAALIAALRQMEFLLRKDPGQDGSRSLVLSGDEGVPRDFRALVEGYFKDLGRGEPAGEPR
jgi:hypothetical protein